MRRREEGHRVEKEAAERSQWKSSEGEGSERGRVGEQASAWRLAGGAELQGETMKRGNGAQRAQRDAQKDRRQRVVSSEVVICRARLSS